ncbi:hypothetical protein GCM10027195_42890 [Comamonas sediminis]
MRLPTPTVDSVQLVSDLVAERAGGRNSAYFAALEGEWRQRVQQYLNSSGAPPSVTLWPAIEPRKTSFLTLYLSPTKTSVQGQMLQDMRQHELPICPACGELGRPNTLDHYLPKDVYPHFCVTPVNLFPMCDACQLAKGTKVGDARFPRFFIHPYFDVFVAERVVYLKIEAPFEAPAFSLEIADHLEQADAGLVRKHIRELAIHLRYATYFRNQYRRLLRLTSAMRNSGQDIRQTLETFRVGAAEPSLNAWEHVFYASVLENDDLIDYLCTAQLPSLL